MYQSPAANGTSSGETFDFDAFARSNATVYVAASRREQELVAPISSAFIEEAGALALALRGHVALDGWRESPGGEPASQLGLALLILTGTVAGTGAEALANRIVARSLNLDDGVISGQPALASPFMHHYLFLALQRLDRRTDIHAIIAARWGRWVKDGRTATPENWSIDFPDGSACHGFSAHPLGWL